MPLIKRGVKKRRLKKHVKKSKISLIIDNTIEMLGKHKDVEKVEVEAKFKIFSKGKKPAIRYTREIVKYR